MKKWLKIWLIVWWSLLFAWWAWAGLTKAWIIPNWLDFELLCPWNEENIHNPINEYICKKFNDSFVCDSDEIVCKLAYPNAYDDYICCNTDNFCRFYMDYPDGVLKPIIYLYPITETQVNVTLWTPENLSHTYPKYNSEKWWNVIAQPNWDLEDVDTWRKFYALYREWKSDKETNFSEWFVVEWKDTIPFLEEKLAILWLNEREAEEFIVYWLPQIENNKYNLIRFETIEEQNENMPLSITPTPDTVIRVMMDRKAINESIDIPEQRLTTPERNWFTVVEWWGSPRN